MRARGFALILVIWVLVLLSILAASFSKTVRVETRSADWAAESTQLEGAMLAAIHRALLGASATDQAKRWQTNGIARRFQLKDIPVDISLRNEGGKIDLNFAPREVLLKFFSQQVVEANAAELTDALLDWRDRDNQPMAAGAESQAYLAAGRHYLPSNGPLTSVAELSQVLGFDDTIVEQLRPYLTVYARSPRIDVGSATLEVVRALPGIDAATAEAFVLQRDAAHAANAAVDTASLDAARRFITNRPSSTVISIELLAHAHGQQHRELAVVRLQSAAGRYEILNRDKVAFANTTDQP